MPFTEEELDAMQKEAEDILAKEEVDASSEVADKKEEEVKSEGGEKKEEKVDDVKKPDDTKAEVKDEDSSIEETRELKRQLRDSTEAYEKLQQKYDRIEKVLKTSGLISEDDEKANAEAEEQAKKNYLARMNVLDSLLETMKLIPGYADVEEVVSQSNFDDVVQAYAKAYIEENGGKLNEVSREIEKEIWSKPNPYSFMYKIIKDVHPKYAKKEEPEKKEDKKEPVKEEEVAPSLSKLPAGAGNEEGAGWTAAKIDDLDEFELVKFANKHPDIYDKYMRGTLK